MFNSYAVHSMYSGAQNLHVGVVLFNLCKGVFSFFVNHLSVCTTEARVTPWSTEKNLATEMSPTLKSDPNMTKNIFASVNRMRQLCGRSVYIVSRRSADTTLG